MCICAVLFFIYLFIYFKFQRKSKPVQFQVTAPINTLSALIMEDRKLWQLKVLPF